MMVNYTACFYYFATIKANIVLAWKLSSFQLAIASPMFGLGAQNLAEQHIMRLHGKVSWKDTKNWHFQFVESDDMWWPWNPWYNLRVFEAQHGPSHTTGIPLAGQLWQIASLHERPWCNVQRQMALRAALRLHLRCVCSWPQMAIWAIYGICRHVDHGLND